MKSKNKPKRQKPKKKQTKQVYFNPWIAKYFDLSGHGIEEKQRGDTDVLCINRRER